MLTFKIRNDDPCVETDLKGYQTFCNICDKWGVKIVQAIVPVGVNRFIDSHMDNETILAGAGDKLLSDNKELLDYMLSRNDLIAVHGLKHTHKPSEEEFLQGKTLLEGWGFKPEYAVFPFNELSTEEDTFAGLKVLRKSQRLEDYMPRMPLWEQIPTDEVVYLHHWRFEHGWYTWDQLDKCLEYLSYV